MVYWGVRVSVDGRLGVRARTGAVEMATSLRELTLIAPTIPTVTPNESHLNLAMTPTPFFTPAPGFSADRFATSTLVVPIVS